MDATDELERLTGLKIGRSGDVMLVDTDEFGECITVDDVLKLVKAAVNLANAPRPLNTLTPKTDHFNDVRPIRRLVFKRNDQTRGRVEFDREGKATSVSVMNGDEEVEYSVEVFRWGDL